MDAAVAVKIRAERVCKQ